MGNSSFTSSSLYVVFAVPVSFIPSWLNIYLSGWREPGPRRKKRVLAPKSDPKRRNNSECLSFAWKWESLWDYQTSGLRCCRNLFDIITAKAYILILAIPSATSLRTRTFRNPSNLQIIIEPERSNVRVQDENFHPFIWKRFEAGGKQWVGASDVCAPQTNRLFIIYT